MTKSNKIYKFLFVFVFLFIVFGLAACDNADKKAAKAVDSAIEALPAEVTLADEEAIVSAREEYDKLTDKQKELVTKLEILETKEAELKDLKDIKSVEDLIALIPETVTLADNAKIQAARTAYNALKSALQSKVSNYNKLQAAETAYQALVASKEAVDEVIDLIDELPDVDDVTLDDKEDVLAAKAAYDALTATEKSQVTNASKLTDLLTKIAQLEADEADREAAEAVDLKIALLPAVVQLTDKEAVEEARAMYDALTEAQKALVTGLNKLTAAETRIVDLEAAKVVIDMIAALPETLTLDDEDDVVAAREAFEALSEVRKGMVTNLDLLKEKEEEIEILKNPDLAVLNPLIKQIPDQIIDDFTFPTAEGVTWAYKDGEDDSLFDLEAGILLKTSFETALRTIEVSYGETTLELVINFGVVKEDFTPIFYVGGAAADKPAEGNNWDGYGTWDKQLAKTGFGGYLIEYGNKVYFISKDAFIPLVGTEENEHLDRETLRPLGMNGQDSRNNLGLINGIPTEYAGTAALYYNAGDVPIKFYGCDTYGRVNAVFAGYGKVVFSRQEDGSYKVGPMIPEHGGGDDVGTKEGSYIITLNPGDYLWTPHTWETDYNNSGFGTRLCSAQGVLTENSPITVKKFKFVQEFEVEYNLDGGSNDPGNPAKIKNYELPFTLKDPVKEGYKFLGWYTKADFSGDPVEKLENLTGKVTLYAKFELIENKITYELDGGTNDEENPDTFTLNDLPVTLKDPVKEGYEFLGWYTKADFSGDPITKIEAAGDITIYAKWELIDYDITYELDGGANDPANPDKYNVEDLPLTLKAPVKDGYKFAGWFENADFSGDPLAVLEGKTGDLTLYAKWEKIHTLTLVTNGGLFYCETKEELIEAFLKDLYDFVNPTDSLSDFMHGVGKTSGYNGTWYSNATYKAKIYAGPRPTEVNEAYFISSSKYMEKWLPFFDMMDEFVNVNPDQHFYGAGTYTGLIRLQQYIIGTKPSAMWTDEDMLMMPEKPIPHELVITFTESTEDFDVPIPVREDEVPFGGWYDNESFSGNPVTKIVKGTKEDVTLYARWLDSTLQGLIDYNVVLNEAHGVYYIMVAVPGEELDTDSITSIKVIMEAGNIIEPRELTPDTDTVLWFGVAKIDGVMTKAAGKYAYEVTRKDNSTYSFFIDYDPEEVIGVPEKIEAEVDYTAVYNEDHEKYYIMVKVPGELLDAASIKSIRTLKQAGEYLAVPVDLVPDTDTVLWFSVALKNKNLSLKENGEYAYEVVKADDSKYVFFFNYDKAQVLQEFLIEYELDGGENDEGNPEKVMSDELPVTLLAPTKLGYEFLGWFDNPAKEGEPVEKLENLTGDVKLYAAWELIDYNIIYDLDEGVNDPANPDKYNVNELPLVLNDPVKEGYEFLGWFDNAAGEGDPITEIPEEFTGELKLYAKWELITYIIEYEFNGGELEYPIFKTRDEMIMAFLTDYYNFLGLTEIDLTTFMHGEGKTEGYDGLYVESAYFTQLYEANNRSIDPSTGKFINQPEYNPKWLPLFDLIAEYVVTGNPTQNWWASPAGVGIYRLKPFIQKRNLWTYEGPEHAAKIEEIVNRIPEEYVLPESYTQFTPTITLRTPSLEGKLFFGWFDNPGFEGLPITEIPTGSKGNLKLYALFVDVLLVVSGSNETSVGEQITLTANLPVTWSSSDETIATVDENGVVTPLAHGEVTIYARSGGQVIGHEIKVYPLPNEIIYEGSEEVLVGGTTKALYKVLAEEGEALQRLVAFESSNTSVFTVNESGIITGVSEGEAILKIKSTLDETVFVEVTVTVLLEDYEFDMSKVAVSGSHVDMEAFVLNGELYVIGKNAFNTLADALTAVDAGATIYVAEGIYANNATVSKNNIKIEGVGKAIIKGTISVSSGVSDLTVKKLNFTDAGQVLIAAAGNVSNFTFEDNYIYDSTATVVSFTNNGTANNSNFVIRNNIFEVVDLKTLTARYIRGGNIVNLTIENNVFVGIKGQYVDAIRIEGNSDANAAGVGASGKVIIKGNLFKNIGQRAIWLRRYSATLVQIYDNEFNYAGDQNYGGGIQLEIWVSGQQTDILIKKNTFKNIEGSFGIRLNNSDLTADATWKVEINYNKFIDFLYPANYDDYVQAYSDAAKGLINADYNYFSVAPTADRMPFVGSYDHQFASEDEVFFAITFAKEFSVGDVVEVMGVVTSRVGNNAFIQDSTGGIYLYLGGNSDYSDILVLGNLVKVIGKLDNYYNLVQIKEIESIELVEEDKGMPEAVEFEDELEFSDLLALQGSIVTIKGFAIKTIPTIGTSSYNVIITNGTIDLTVRVDQYIDAYNDVKNAMNALLVGQYVDFYNIPVSQYNADAQLMLSTLEQMDVIPLSDDVVADLIADVIKSKYDGKIFPMGDVIELITSVEGFAGEITWSADSEVIDLETGLIAEVTEDTNVNLTATILVDEVEITETVAILVKYVEPAELEFNFDFEGGLGSQYVNDTSTATYENLVDNSDFDVEVHSCAGNKTGSVAFATKALVLRPRTGDNDGIAWAEFDFGDVDVKRMTFDAYYWSNQSILLMTKFELQVKVGEDWVTVFDILEFLGSSLDINTITVYDLEGSIFRFYAEGGQNKSNTARVLVDNLLVYA